MNIEIPESEDIEWQQDMLRELSNCLDNMARNDEATEQLDLALEIVDALRQYSGY
ncbi:hypothetical protein M5494_004389 [Salmonella enterica]|nr:hypothetical protein [Salmonella enterica]